MKTLYIQTGFFNKDLTWSYPTACGISAVSYISILVQLLKLPFLLTKCLVCPINDLAALLLNLNRYPSLRSLSDTATKFLESGDIESTLNCGPIDKSSLTNHFLNLQLLPSNTHTHTAKIIFQRSALWHFHGETTRRKEKKKGFMGKLKSNLNKIMRSDHGKLGKQQKQIW